MPTMSGSKNLAARLRVARGRPAEEDRAAARDTGPKESSENDTVCTSSVMAGQRCARAAVAGGRLCANHLAMLGTPVTR
jgi:hypothetical protein